MARLDSISIVQLGQLAEALGLRLAATLFPAGDPIRDKGHQALIARFVSVLHAAWLVAREVPLPNVGDPRAWDLVLRLPACIIGVEAETRLRDIQALVRRIHQRERDGGVQLILLVLAESATNRRVLPELMEALGPRYATSARAILRALRTGQPLPGSGVLLV